MSRDMEHVRVRSRERTVDGKATVALDAIILARRNQGHKLRSDHLIFWCIRGHL